MKTYFNLKTFLIIFIFFSLVLKANFTDKKFASNQPFASFWFPNELLNWSPEADQDAPFNKAAIKLQSRFTNPNFKVNAHAKEDQARIAALDIFNSTSQNPSQGSLDSNYFCFNYWQYIDLLVFWGGSAGEGLILTPNSNVINAAHKNGVKVLGTIFFPPVAYGGDISWVHDLLIKEGNSFPVADKLIEACNYYGFDGYFINQETAGGNAELASLMQEFMIYIQENSEIELMWYDAMTESGSISWQEMLNSNNDAFFQDGETLVSQSMFLDFGWSKSKLQNSRTNAQDLNRSEYELYAGVDVQANCYNTYVNWNSIFPENEDQITSMGLYVPSSTYHGASSIKDFYQRANRFWVGANQDPSSTQGGSWPGFAHFVSAKSVIDQLPFVTNFSTGQGYGYYLNGEKKSNFGWNNIELQDILPTWRWLIESSGEKLKAKLDFNDAYYGGNCLKISGNLTANNNLWLYKTALNLSENSSLELSFKMDAGATSSNLKIGLAFNDNPTQFEFLDLGNSENSNWQQKVFDLSQFANRELGAISLFFSGAGVNDYSIKIGRIAIYDEQLENPLPPTNFRIVDKAEDEMNEASFRLRWEPSSSDAILYNIYYKTPSGNSIFLGATPNDALFIPKVQRLESEAEGILEIEAVNQNYLVSEKKSCQFVWEAVQAPEKATMPNPANSSIPVRRDLLLEWIKGKRTISHNIYFGTENPPPYFANSEIASLNMEDLAPKTTYYWRVDEVNEEGVTEGDLWQFTTESEESQIIDRTDESGSIIEAQGENSGEEKEKAFDNNINTKWLDFDSESWILYGFANDQKYKINEYSLTSANDAEERDPEEWLFKGSNDKVNWEIIDQRSGIDFPQRKMTKHFIFPNYQAYKYYKFEFKNNFGTIFQLAEIELFEYDDPQSINEIIPKKTKLIGNYPNPFNPSTKIAYCLAEAGEVSLRIYDVQGKLVKEILNQKQAAGYYRLNWNAQDRASGTYYIRLKTNNFDSTIKALLIK